VWRFENSQGALSQLFERDLTLFKPLATHWGYDLDHSSIVDTIRKSFNYKHSTLNLVAILLAAYAVIELIEGVGLWLAKRWGEYFAAVATALFLPIEIYELTEHATTFKIATFSLNVLAVLYLVLAKRLFGLRGGGKAYEAQLTSESLLAEMLPERLGGAGERENVPETVTVPAAVPEPATALDPVPGTPAQPQPEPTELLDPPPKIVQA
jgi:uncharacterized membrane protein (DUF2068 family)